MLLSGEELVSLVHLPDASVRYPGLVREERRTKTLPPSALHHPHTLGENRHRGQSAIATLSDTERLQHTWIVGASGTGKSTLLLNLIVEDISLGHGVAVLDPHGDLIDDVLARVPRGREANVILFDPSDTEWPVGFNILSAGSEGERTILASDLVGIFRRFSTSWGDTMGTVLGNAVLVILEHPRGGTLLDLRRLLVDERFRKEYLREVEDEEGFSYFEGKDFASLGRGEAIVRLGSSSHDFNLKTFPASAVSEEDANTRREMITALSRERYAFPVEELKARLREQYGTKEEAVLTTAPETTEQVAPPPSTLPPVLARMKAETKERREKLHPPEPPTPGRGGQEHKYLQHLVKRLAEERGFRAVIEEAAGDGRADVVLTKESLRIAVEVSVTTDPEHEAENLKKCQAAGFERIVFVVPDKKRREKLALRFKEETAQAAVIGPEQLAEMLDACDPGPQTSESTVRGYKVKVTRQALSPAEAAHRRAAVAAVIAKTLLKGR